MNLDFKIDWQLLGAKHPDLDPSLFQILEGVRREGSLKNSAVSAGLSYRHAWGLIKKWEKEFKAPLLILERGRGRGAKLTELGEKLLWADQYLQEQLVKNMGPLRVELNEIFAEYLHPGERSRIRLFASHGMAITCFYELLTADQRFDIDFQIHGSLDSLRNLNSGHCQMAGFHLPLQLVAEIVAPQYRQWLVPNRHELLQVAVRLQGLMLKKGNPKNITTLQNLTRRSVRFINRQRYSGTRTIFDQLLVKEKINPKDISGYTNEEFTHVAVAAMIASGAADAGFGIAAAAEQFNLDFIPYLQEAYVLAMETSLNTNLKKAVKKQLQSDVFRRKINHLAGYNADQSGRELSFHELLGEK